MAKRDAITAARLREILEYDPETGIFIWKNTKARRIRNGEEAGSIRPFHRGTELYYRIINVDYSPIGAHRLAWLYMTGEWPTLEVDHIDRDGTNNRWSNLRLSTSSQNKFNRGMQANNAVGLKGVCWHPQSRKFRATISAHGKQKHLGLFDCPAAAHFAYIIAAEKMHGEFARLT